MKYALSLLLFVIAACGGKTTVTVAASTSSPSPSRTSAQQLQAVLDADPQLQADVCFNFKKLVSVGWPEDVVPSMLVQIGPAGTPMFLSKAEVSELGSAGMSVKAALVDIFHRC